MACGPFQSATRGMSLVFLRRMLLTGPQSFAYCSTNEPLNRQCDQRRLSMPVLIRKYKGHTGVMQEERIDDDDRIERYLRIFEKEDVKKLETGAKVFIEKDEWQLLP
jgi:hypothetical protein